ncbi:MAG: (S)-sulfolactate dehydrogenase [Candidatus Moanabacter tarae]|uniref:(S)-sulfolactate dehydrogenase n=1 Tax=Candidatus Moanibacter tarae TaxID=2200854 RepID=A0A2Z4AF88_9BACT|nr:MAG: (S)-sulfolactate dehydrogenase [Candidatus Moanabacter tarae]|tara:strand:- start:3507 stop:4448 length:942 start_codon:yes stop_codon:yes gene_type:complete
MKIVMNPPIGEIYRQQIAAVAPNATVVMPSSDELLNEMCDAEILFGSYSGEIISSGPLLKWVQSTSAGMDISLIPEVMGDNLILTNASGVHAIQVAEQAFALTLAIIRGVYFSVRAQREHKWQRPDLRDFYGMNVAIIGFGGIGRRYAELIRPNNTQTIALDVHPIAKVDTVDAIWPMERLDEALEIADVVFIACPCTEKTIKLINKRTLGIMKKDAILINTARGKIVDEQALVAVLKEGGIGAAGLDVFEEEPLDESSDLWELENVIITPHAAGGSPHRHDRTVGFFAENLRRYLKGDELQNVVDKSLGYPT